MCVSDDEQPNFDGLQHYPENSLDRKNVIECFFEHKKTLTSSKVLRTYTHKKYKCSIINNTNQHKYIL